MREKFVKLKTNGDYGSCLFLPYFIFLLLLFLFQKINQHLFVVLRVSMHISHKALIASRRFIIWLMRRNVRSMLFVSSVSKQNLREKNVFLVF